MCRLCRLRDSYALCVYSLLVRCVRLVCLLCVACAVRARFLCASWVRLGWFLYAACVFVVFLVWGVFLMCLLCVTSVILASRVHRECIVCLVCVRVRVCAS